MTHRDLADPDPGPGGIAFRDGPLLTRFSQLNLILPADPLLSGN